MSGSGIDADGGFFLFILQLTGLRFTCYIAGPLSLIKNARFIFLARQFSKKVFVRFRVHVSVV